METLYGILFIIGGIIEKIISFIIATIKLPIRYTKCRKNGHNWLWLGNGFFGMFAPKKPLKCTKCSKKSTWDDMDKL